MLPRCHRPKELVRAQENRRAVRAHMEKKGWGCTRAARTASSSFSVTLELLPPRLCSQWELGMWRVARSDHRIVLAVVVLFLTIILDDLDGLCARDDCLDAVVGPAIARQEDGRRIRAQHL